MKNLQFLGVILIVTGSFLPLVHVPVIGNWNYWKVDHYLAGACWVFAACSLFGIINNRQKLVKISGIMLMLLFTFTVFAVKYQAFSYFSFLPFKSWTETLVSTVRLQWGWIVEFLGALILVSAKGKNN